jgi:hypothetical protein
MQVNITPKMAKKLADLTAATGRGPDDLVQDALAGYLQELAVLQDTVDNRYDDLKSGRVQAVDGEEAFTRLRDTREDRRSRPA